MELASLINDPSLRELLSETTIERAKINRSENKLYIYLASARLLQYKHLALLQKELSRQFPPDECTLIIKIRFYLSEQYTPQAILENYWPSIVEESREALGMLDYSILKKSAWHCKDDKLILTAQASPLVSKNEKILTSFIINILRERFALDLACEWRYTKAKASAKITPVYHAPIIEKAPAPESSAPLPEPETAEKPALKKRKNDDPSLIYGRNFDGESTPISEIADAIGEVIIAGQIIKLDVRELRSEKKLAIFAVTDFHDTIQCKVFLEKEQANEFLDKLKLKSFIKLKGMAMIDKYDREVNISSIRGIRLINDFTAKRQDNSPEKRVELHAHTLMSDMDGLVDVKELIKRAKAWGHEAIAVTDHGVVQSFPEAFHTIKPDEPFKVIYGCEIYLVDDLKAAVSEPAGQSLDTPVVVFDLETTGFSALNDKIIEIGAVKLVNGEIVDRFSTFVNPEIPIPYEIEKLTSISDEMVLDAPTIEEILPKFIAFCENCAVAAHNADFDNSFITANAARLSLPWQKTVLDTVTMARILLPNLHNHKLDTVAKELEISLENHHRAVDDAEATALIYQKLMERFSEQGVTSFDEINNFGKLSIETVKKMPTYHAIVLAQNDIGRVNLYKLISLSHLDYYARRPRIPRSLLEENREGLILGSACEAGELVQAILRNVPHSEINRIVNFYDYLEIQPLDNNAFMLASDKHPQINSMSDLEELNKTIVRLGEEFNKPVCATCDVHFLDPEDEVYRRIIMAGKGFPDADNQAPLYLRTTEEMLEEFKYLGREKAYEVVVTNTRKINSMIEKIAPVRPDKCPPVIADSDKTLRQICYEKAHSIYGENLPSQVEERLEHELKSIIGNGFAVMYIIAQKLVWKSNDDGYLVGSRGSVGSSLAATMAGITEVNPLPPHYYCAECHYSEFDSDEVKKYRGMSGCDMPDKVCPVCGAQLKKEGHDIPFETFLGFNGDKEPDIDLNFSGDYQPVVHAYTEEIFGKGHTFRAGTIGTLAEKTAYGYVLKYFEERGQTKRSCEIERLSQGCVGVRRTTGQHPGGIIVLPHGEEIYSFTPVQHPANDTHTSIITTHFDYHSIDHNLLKLDILGHDDPTMIKRLEELTGFSAKQIPLNEEKVLSLFKNTSALGITPDDLTDCELGCLGVPEFGTDFAMQMLKETKPKCFSDLARIAGLSHGTDVWLNNTQELIKSGKCDLQSAICTRDDIMTYLIGMGLESGTAFKIMENVRKGKVAGHKCDKWDDWKAVMLEHGVPEWYIWSCERIQYMFPKAHAVAYVMMAVRIAYYKVYYPHAYYAAYFAIRASGFDYELMCQGADKLNEHIKDFKSRSSSLSQKEQDSYKDMRVVQEMYARGIDFMPIDIYRAKAHKFQIFDGKIMPALDTIDGLGDKAADSVEEAAKMGEFLSRDDFRKRTKLSTTVVETMHRLNLLQGLPESNQLSILDMFG